MITFAQRTTAEQDIIRKAYDFEVTAIENGDYADNPYYNAIKAMKEGDAVWEGINLALEMHYN